MTRKEFEALPWLVMEHHLVALGYARWTVLKFADCGVLTSVRPAGAGQARYRKRQVAQLIHWDGEWVAAAMIEWGREPAVIPLKTVMRWTGWSDMTLSKIGKARGLTVVKPPGSDHGKFLKEEVGRLIGF